MSMPRLAAVAGLVSMLTAAAVHAAPIDDVKTAYERQDYQAALRDLLPLAEAGDPDAQYIAGYMYGHGQGTESDTAKSLAWYRAAAGHGSGDAQFALGLAYEEGRGVPQDYAEAAKWYGMAANLGLPRAQNNLGNLYNNGFGPQQSFVMAYMWYALASQGGDDRATRNLALVEQVMSQSDSAEAKRLVRDWRMTHLRQLAQP